MSIELRHDFIIRRWRIMRAVERCDRLGCDKPRAFASHMCGRHA